MDRTEEIKELMVRLVTLLAEEQSQMREEISALRKAVERIAENTSRASSEILPSGNTEKEPEPEKVPEVEPAPEKMPEVEPEPEKMPEVEPEPVVNPEPERTSELGEEPEPEKEPEPEPVEEPVRYRAPIPFRFKDFPGDEEQCPAGGEPEENSGQECAPGTDDDPEINPGADFDPDAEPEFVVEPIRALDEGSSEPAVSAVSVEPADEPVKSAGAPRSGVLRPRSREEQISDTSQWGMFFNSDVSADSSRGGGDTPVIGELFSASEVVSPKEPSWMNDIPGPRVNSVYEALTNNDRFQFIRDLFDDDDEQFTLSMDRIDQCRSFGQAVSEMRVAFPDWDESSSLVYQFYMMVRRRFR